MCSEWIPDSDWKTIVRSMPIPSVDLVVRSPTGIVLGKRANEPAEGTWFVPGGRIQKGERFRAAVDRVAREELGVDDVELRERIGVYEHLYDDAAVIEGGKHYVAVGFVVEVDVVPDDLTADDQHTALRTFPPDDLPGDVHEYSLAYLADAESIPVSEAEARSVRSDEHV